MSEPGLGGLHPREYGEVDRMLARLTEQTDAAIQAFARQDTTVLLSRVDRIESLARSIRDTLTEDDS